MTVSSKKGAVSSEKTGAKPIFGRFIICLVLTVFLFTVAEEQQRRDADISA
jgi:hypothetical protein